MIKNTNKKIQAFSLIEIIVSLAIFSFIITTVMIISFKMINTQKNIQAELFLAQTAQTTLESMSRQIRYGYNYAGNSQTNYNSSEGGNTITLNNLDVSTATGSSATTSQNLVNAQNSPFILFEGQSGNPNSPGDQLAFCAYGGKLRKISKFNPDSVGLNYSAKCSDGVSMFPDNISLTSISFDIYGGDSQNPKNPMVRIKMSLKHNDDAAMDVQTTVTQRLVSYF